MPEITQENRRLAIDTPLGEDVLLIDEFSGSEAVSEPFHFDVTLLADTVEGNDAKVDPKALLGKGVTIHVRSLNGKERLIHGLVRRFQKGEVASHFASYSVELVPWLWLLSLRSNCRIYQNLTVPEVIEAVFDDLGMKDYRLSLTKTYTKWDYCVQYRETDLNFVSRLMEEVGIWYYFEHEQDKHTLVLVDAPSSYKPCPDADEAELDVQSLGEDNITTWEEGQELYPGKWTLRDYHFELPKSTLEATSEAQQSTSATQSLEIYDFPGGQAQRFNEPGARLGDVPTEAQRLADLRMEMNEGEGVLVEGSSSFAAFTPGFKISVSSKSFQEISGSYVLTSVQHSGRQMPPYLADDNYEQGSYHNRFTCVPATAPLHPARTTPKPSVQGPQSARVVDESSNGATEEIWPDKYGRVRVRFPWDRKGVYSCWVRVAQPRAGKSWGHIWIPRVGDEVLIAFLEGDPDCPVIVGSLYNADNPVPYTLPDNKTQSGIKTRSSPKGGTDNFNEIRFEDKKGSEELFVQAEKDYNVNVKNDRTTKIGNNETKTIDKGDEKITLNSGNQTTTISKGDQTLDISTGKQTNTIQGDQTTTVNMGKQVVAVKMGDQTTTLDMGNITTQCKVGNISMKCDLGKVTIEALQGIELKGWPEQHQGRHDGNHDKGSDGERRRSGPDQHQGADDAGERRRDADGQGCHHHDRVSVTTPSVSRAGKSPAELAAAAELGDAALGLLTPQATHRAFVQQMIDGGHHTDAIRFLAHAIPSREGVWWAWVTAKRSAGAEPPPPVKAALDATERWIAQPTEENRRAAMTQGEALGFGEPAGCAALAAFFSGPTLAPAHIEQPVPPPEFATAKAIVGAIMLASIAPEPKQAPENYLAAIQQGLEVVTKIKLWPEG